MAPHCPRTTFPEPDGNFNLRRSYRIALIEGDALMRELADRWLSEAGHDVVRVSVKQLNSQTALDLIMVDVANPRGAIERVRALRAAHSAPLLLVSGRLRRRNDLSPTLALQLGASAVLPKPYTREQLFGAVAAALSTDT
jgi:DNA-binding response OmpR family regulator